MAPPKKKGGGTLDLGAAPPPPPSKKNSGPPSAGAALQALTKLPGEGRYSQWIGIVKNAAQRWGVDPVELMATLMWEGGQASTTPNPAGAVGLAQIVDTHIREELNPDQYQTFLREIAHGNTTITPQEAADPVFAINYMAWRMGGTRRDYQSLNAWYSSPGYNPGYTGDSRGAGPEALLQKAHVGTYQASIPQSPQQKAGASVDYGNAKATYTDKWAVLAQGKVKFVAVTDPNTPPKNVLTYAGQPLTETTFAQTWKQVYQSTWQAYTGRPASGKEIKQILSEAPDAPTLALQLANRPGFTKSPVYQRTAPGLVGLARSILGNDWQPHGGLIRDAIVQNWDQATFETHLRQLPEYTKGPEYRTNLDQNTKAFEGIYGVDSTADPTVQALLRDKTKAGWSPDQLSLWAQQQPAYKSSPAYMTKMVSFLQQLGLITGNPATITQAQVDAMLNSAHNVANVTTAVDQAGGVHAGTSPANPTGTSVVPGRGTISVH